MFIWMEIPHVICYMRRCMISDDLKVIFDVRESDVDTAFRDTTTQEYALDSTSNDS